MRKTIAFAVAITILTAAFQVPAYAGWENGRDINGLTSNGLTSNGLTSNGLTSNGLTGNGLTQNALSSNGVTINDTQAPASPRAGIGTVTVIELPLQVTTGR